jgi:D-alanyl-lipoteichoic acid acyltransferase DltB (MBOAT superfamily)
MLFSSSHFLFVFLPLTVMIVALAGHFMGRSAALISLIVASLVFYGWWNPPYLLLIGVSIGINFALGLALMQKRSKAILALAIIFNLGLLGYYKYAEFFTSIANDLFNVQIDTGNILLPLAISFFTFQQIAYQVDVYEGKIRDKNFARYSLFVCFFPQLIAGPIVHHREVTPQFENDSAFRLTTANVLAGSILFVIGLFKKVVIADGLDPYADALFNNALTQPTLIDAWAGTFAYGFQIYFDFSAYTDMAMGLARFFNIRLPLNFFSPYKAVNIVDFWRRWHITLSRFLRDYLYVPLGGNRKGRLRRYVNLFITMLLGGLWHGASWTFVAWGALHGMYLVINHAWQKTRRYFGADMSRSTPLGRGASRLLTLLAVMVAWTFFRADSFSDAFAVLSGMAGINGLVLSQTLSASMGGITFGLTLGETILNDPILFVWLFVLLLIVWFAPNTQEITAPWQPYLPSENPDIAEELKQASESSQSNRLNWLMPCAVTLGLACFLIVAYRGGKTAEFIYFAF